MNRQLLEIASWRLVTELLRRWPDRFDLIHTHPGGGQYDCLTLLDRNDGRQAYLNREGAFTIFDDAGGMGTRIDGDRIWPRAVEAPDLKELVDEFSAALGLVAPNRLPPSTPEVLVYRIVCAFLAHAAFGQATWTCINGYCDTSGFSGGPMDRYFARFPTARERVRERVPADVFDEPAYRFWFLMRENVPRLCLEKTGLAHTLKGEAVDLVPLYRGTKRIWPLVQAVAGDLLP